MINETSIKKTSLKEFVVICALFSGLLFWINLKISQILFCVAGILSFIGLLHEKKISKRLLPYIYIMFYMVLVSLNKNDIVRIVEWPVLITVIAYIYNLGSLSKRIKKKIIIILKIIGIVIALPLSSNQSNWEGFYCGIFTNPDMLGYFECLIYCIILIQTHEYYWNRKLNKAKLNLLYLCIPVVFSLLSQARMSIICIVISTIGLVFFEILYLKRNCISDKRGRYKRIKHFTKIIFILFFIMSLLLILSGSLQGLIVKMTNVVADSERINVHSSFISNAKLFGSSRKDFTTGTDSTFIYLLAYFGPIAAVWFYLLLLRTLRILIKSQLKGKLDFDGFYVIGAMGIFCLQSLTSDMFFTTAMFLAIIFNGIVMSECKVQLRIQ